ncbi:MAG: 1-deoxy-D-xylulose-5-phosphate reductoisomerase [Pseudomonadota bacterium]
MAYPINNDSRGITILGSTGSIGVNTLDVIKRHPERFHVVALTAHRDSKRLFQQCVEFQPAFAVLVDAEKALGLQQRLDASDCGTQLLSGVEALERVAALAEVDYVMAAIVGAAGLLPTLAAVRAGKRILLANKEALVMSGQLFMKEVHDHGAQLLPIDSEHNAVFQCLPVGFERGLSKVGVERIVLTASGGPFRDTPLEALAEVTPEQACAHPNWVMGRKISVDSATMMNKGLEVIEACWLFDARPNQVDVVLHPQSVIHSLAVYSDGSVLAQLGNPDMRTPIAHALAWPQRLNSGVKPLDLIKVAHLDFDAPDLDRFPCLRLAREALEAGGTATAILNAANEVAVASFLQKEIAFMDIPIVIDSTLESLNSRPADSLDVVLEADRLARQIAHNTLSRLAS